MRPFTLFVLATLLAPVACSGASAGEIAERADQAEKALAAGHPGEAFDALEAALDAAWNASPLSFRKTLFVEQKPTGFGAYVPRNNSVFAPGEPIYIYIEPIGFNWMPEGNAYTCNLVVDMLFRDKSGAVIHEKREVGHMIVTSRVKNHEFMLDATLRIQGLPVGDYEIDNIVRDENSKKWNKFTLAFQVRE